MKGSCWRARSVKRKTRLPIPLLTIADLVFDMLAPGPGREPPNFGASFSVPFFTNKPADRQRPTITQFSPVNN